MEEASMFIIKPEALEMETWLHIASRIRGIGLKFEFSDVKTRHLNNEDIQLLYPKMDLEMARAALEHLGGKNSCDVCIVRGYQAVERLRKLRGSNIDPQKCSHQTIRGQFSYRSEKVVLPNGRTYHKNIIDCPSPEEAAIHVAWATGLARSS